MDGLLNDEDKYYNEHKDMMRSQWEDAHIAEKDKLAYINDDNRRLIKNDYVRNNGDYIKRQMSSDAVKVKRD